MDLFVQFGVIIISLFVFSLIVLAGTSETISLIASPDFIFKVSIWILLSVFICAIMYKWLNPLAVNRLKSYKIKDKVLRATYKKLNKILSFDCIDIFLGMDRELEHFNKELKHLKAFIDAYKYLNSNKRGLGRKTQSIAVDNLEVELETYIDSIELKLVNLRDENLVLEKEESDKLFLEVKKEFLEEENTKY